MPGILMHLLEGEIIINKINNKLNREQLLLGCVLPDITDDKELTHFRPEDQKNLITKYPDMDYILGKYKNEKLSVIDMGILAHLHLDAYYVKDFWPRYFNFEDESGTSTCDMRNQLYVRVCSRGNEIIPLDIFFSKEYFYGEYDIFNPLIYKNFKPFIPIGVNYDAGDICIKECRPKSKKAADIFLKKNLPAYCFDSSIKIPDYASRPKIFPQNEMLAFFEEAANDFLSIYKRLSYSASV